MYTYTDRVTGRAISRTQHISQCVGVLLTTRLGTRVRRRQVGSNIPLMVDSPLTAGTISDIYQDVASVLFEQEKRIIPRKITVDEIAYQKGRLVLTVQGVTVPQNTPITISGIEVQ